MVQLSHPYMTTGKTIALTRRTFVGKVMCLLFNMLSSSVQFSSVAQLCPTLCDPMNHSMPGLPVHQQLPEFIQTHIHRVSDTIQPSHPLSSTLPPAPNPSQHQSLFISWLQSPSAVILEPPKIKSVTVSIVSSFICHEMMGLDAMILVS